MTIRPAGPADVSAVFQLVTGILQAEFPQDQAAYPTEDLQRLTETYRGPENVFLVAEEDGHLVGTCGVKSENKKTAILRRLFVDASHRDQGVGFGLLQEALNFCRKQGFREVVIRTSTQMERAIRLCCSLGFQEDGRWTLDNITLVRFRLKIT